jgi:Ran GTPase-activating protein (RanGAP) involved in mRNA processing and transport
MRLPAVVRLSRSFWCDTRNGTAAEKLKFVMRQLKGLTVRCSITTLELPRCEMRRQDAERLARVLEQCPALAHLHLSGNQIGDAGAESFAEVLAQCAALAHLNLRYNGIGSAGAESLAGVLTQCRELTHLDLRGNPDVGGNLRKRIRASWGGQISGLHLKEAH